MNVLFNSHKYSSMIDWLIIDSSLFIQTLVAVLCSTMLCLNNKVCTMLRHLKLEAKGKQKKWGDGGWVFVLKKRYTKSS